MSYTSTQLDFKALSQSSSNKDLQYELLSFLDSANRDDELTILRPKSAVID